MVSVPTGQGPIDAVLETPDGTGPWPGVVVVHDALGIGRDIRDITARVAAHGYLTLTPDLYTRGGRTRGGRTRCVVGTFRDLIRRRGRAVDDLLSARDLLVARPDCTGRVGVIGFCMGGGFALVLAPEGFDAAAPFYGPLPRDIEEALGGSCPFVGSYGARDPMLRGAGRKLDSALTRLGVARRADLSRRRAQFRQPPRDRPLHRTTAARHGDGLRRRDLAGRLASGVRVLRFTPVRRGRGVGPGPAHS